MNRGFYIGYKGRIEAYIYIWFSREYGLVYVGETNNSLGVIGRASQHILAESGTLYSRVFDQGYNIYQIDDFVLLSYSLPREKRYISEETSYRISVEYLVQKMLIEKRIESERPYRIISNVKPGAFTGLECNRKLAKSIVDDFFDIYEKSNQ